MLQIVLVLALLHLSACDNFSSINLPQEHLPYYFASLPNAAEKCRKDKECPYEKYLDKDLCWGYEFGCQWEKQYSRPFCPGDHRGWVKSKKDQERTFYTQADFGFVKQQLKELMVLCEPLFIDDSSLECSEHLRFCRGRNIMVNLTKLISRDEPSRYKMDVLEKGDIGKIICFFFCTNLKTTYFQFI